MEANRMGAVFFEVSAKENTQVKELFDRAARELYDKYPKGPAKSGKPLKPNGGGGGGGCKC